MHLYNTTSNKLTTNTIMQRLNRTHVQRRVQDILGEDATETRQRFDPRDDRDRLSSCDTIVPDHQRYFVWDVAKIGAVLIDTVMNDYPIPSFIFSSQIENGKRILHVQDGQQRLTTLQKFMLDEFCWDGKKFSEFSKKEERTFLGYILQCEIIEDPTPEQISNIFERINNSKPLSHNDKFWNRKHTPIMEFIMIRLIKHPDMRGHFTNLVGDVGSGKTRKLMGDITGAVVSIANASIDTIRTTYEIIGPLLGRELCVETEEFVISVFRDYFRIITSACESHCVTAPSKVFGKLSVMLGMYVYYRVSATGDISDTCWEWYAIHCQSVKWREQFFATLPAGCQRNLVKESIDERLKYFKQYVAIHGVDNVNASGGDCDDNDDESV